MHCMLRCTIRGLGLLFEGLEHGMDLKALVLGHGKHLKAHYARLGGPAKAPTFKVAKIDPLEILSHTARGQDFIQIGIGRRGVPPTCSFFR